MALVLAGLDPAARRALEARLAPALAPFGPALPGEAICAVAR
jgi:hypothetical protein